jgi:hypothetical protein
MHRSNLNDDDRGLHDRVERILLKGIVNPPSDARGERPQTTDAGPRKSIPLFTQPEPETTIVARNRGITAIARRWAADDQHRCRLCQTCHASDDGVCLVTTTRQVADEDAALFSK